MRTAQGSMPSEAVAIRQTRRQIPLGEPSFRGNEWTYLRECLDTGWVSSVGPFVERFERKVAAYVGATHAVGTVNGTAALHVALHVAGVRPDDEVLVSDLTFIAPVNAIHYCQAHPVFMDAHPRTWQMDVDKVARFLTEECERRDDACYNRRTGRRIRAILPVHILGLACEMDRIVELAKQYHLRVVEDAAEAMGVRYRNRHVGTWGHIGVLSFNGNKIMTAGAGGMVLTDQRVSAEAARFAEDAQYLTTQAKGPGMEYVHQEVGYNYRLSNLEAAVGLAQLEQLDGFIARKRAIARTYDEAFHELDDLSLMQPLPETEPTSWLYTVLLPPGTTLDRRRAVIRYLNEHGIGARPLWHPIHGLPPYRDCQAFAIEHAMALHERAVSLPCSVGLEADELERCVTVFKQSLSAA